MKMNLKEFFKPNKFKIIFSLIFIVITLLVLLIGDSLHSKVLEIVFAILYFPALVFAGSFRLLPIFKRCFDSFGEEICHNDSTVALILSIPVFISYVYALSCLLYSVIIKIKK